MTKLPPKNPNLPSFTVDQFKPDPAKVEADRSNNLRREVVWHTVNGACLGAIISWASHSSLKWGAINSAVCAIVSGVLGAWRAKDRPTRDEQLYVALAEKVGAQIEPLHVIPQHQPDAVMQEALTLGQPAHMR